MAITASQLSVSTHSRTEAAAKGANLIGLIDIGFNTQPHGGGCSSAGEALISFNVSTHSRTEAAAYFL